MDTEKTSCQTVDKLIIRLADQAPTRGGQSLHFEEETLRLATG